MDRRAALGVVLAAHGYPEAPRKGDEIRGLDRDDRRRASRLQGVPRGHRGRRRAGRRRRGPCPVRDGARRLGAAGADERATPPSPRSASTACSTAPTSGIARWPRARPERGADRLGCGVSAPRDWLVGLQARIVERLEAIDGTPFRSDEWTRLEGGGGIARVIEDGNVLERGGVNFSHVKGDKLPPSATAARPTIAGRAWEAM